MNNNLKKLKVQELKEVKHAAEEAAMTKPKVKRQQKAMGSVGMESIEECDNEVRNILKKRKLGADGSSGVMSESQ